MPMRNDRIPSRRFPRACRGGCFAKLLVTGVIFGVLCVVAWVLLLPSVITRAIESRTGFEVKVTSLSVNPFTARIAIDGLVITNPPAEFSEPGFVQVKSFKADAELASLFTDRIVLEEAEIDIDRITIVQNARHDNNGVLFGKRMAGESTGESSPGEAPGSGKPASRSQKEFLIRELHLRLDKVVLVDASGTKASSKELSIAFSQDYENVTSTAQIATPIVAQVVARGGSIREFASELGRDAVSGAKKAGETIKGIFESIKDKVKK